MKKGKCKMVNRDFFKAEFDYPTTQGPSGSQDTSLKSVAEAEPSELFAFKECQDLVRKRLTEAILRLIPQLTGLRLHVLWHRPMDFRGSGEMPVLCPRARQRAGVKGRQPNPDIRCRGCLRRRWKPALHPANQGRRFIGQCGVTNFCAYLQVDNVRPLTLVLQARVASVNAETQRNAEKCGGKERSATLRDSLRLCVRSSQLGESATQPTASRRYRIFPFLFCPLLAFYGGSNQNHKYEDLYQINRAGVAHAGIGRLRLER